MITTHDLVLYIIPCTKQFHWRFQVQKFLLISSECCKYEDCLITIFMAYHVHRGGGGATEGERGFSGPNDKPDTTVNHT